MHVVSRTAGREILFGDRDKEMFHQILFKQIKFSGLRVIAWCFMGNHFHLLLEVPDREQALAALSEDDILARLSVLSGEMSTKFLLDEIDTRRQLKDGEGLRQIAERVSERLFDLSMFMKELKQRMTLAFNYAHGRTGALWDGRFKSLLVQGGDAVRAVAAYIDLNPVRAGLVREPEAYRWCSYAAALGGIGGVHRGAELSFDVSSDLGAMSRHPVIVVSAGAKAFLDLPKTLEVLETLSVPVIGYQTSHFPAFWSRSSGLGLSHRVESAAEIAAIAKANSALGWLGGMLVANPIPAAAEIPAAHHPNCVFSWASSRGW